MIVLGVDLCNYSKYCDYHWRAVCLGSCSETGFEWDWFEFARLRKF